MLLTLIALLIKFRKTWERIVPSALRYKGGLPLLEIVRFIDFTRARAAIMPTACLTSASTSTTSYDGSTLPASNLVLVRRESAFKSSDQTLKDLGRCW